MEVVGAGFHVSVYACSKTLSPTGRINVYRDGELALWANAEGGWSQAQP